MPDIKKNINKLNVINSLFILVPVIIFITYVYAYAINIPRQDDYDAILSFITLFKKANFSSKISLLFLPHNDHRILSTRIICACYYSIFGCINFRHLIFINALSLLSIFALLINLIKESIIVKNIGFLQSISNNKESLLF